ncbi:MAG: hypothetical protein EG822_18065 [Deltaproteobacteria bacterium]|nr:hypothetical protein [Deltaproteobacteria bacterium]TLN00911.1 MAG: hypothetical protein FDZ73_17795 [bacterium]
MDWIARVKQATIQEPDPLDVMETEYHDTLTRYWSPEARSLSDDELEKMLSRLDDLFQELTSQGRRLPVLTPEGRAYLKEV